jgi:hypothetical protein
MRRTKGCVVEKGWEESEKFVNKLNRVFKLNLTSGYTSQMTDMTALVLQFADNVRKQERTRILDQMRRVAIGSKL